MRPTPGTPTRAGRRAAHLFLVAANPFADLKAAVQGNPKREYFISRAEAEKVLDAGSNRSHGTETSRRSKDGTRRNPRFLGRFMIVRLIAISPMEIWWALQDLNL
jgi:hypothetical protein